MKTRSIPLFLVIILLLTLFTGCTMEVSSGSADPESTPTQNLEPDCVIVFDGATVSIDGVGARLDDGEVLIYQAGVYQVSGVCENSRLMVKAGSTDDVTVLLSGLTLTNPEDEAIYFKTAGSASVVLLDGSDNTLTGGIEPEPQDETADTINVDERPEEDTATGAALRSICPMAISGEGTLTVRGYINNGIAADGGLTITGGTLDVTAVNNGIKSDSDIAVTGGSITVYAEGDGVQAGNTLDITGGELNVTTGGGAEEAEMKVSDSLMMGGGMGGNRRARGSEEASTEADTASESAESATAATDTEATSKNATTDSEASAETADSDDTETQADASASEEISASREIRGGMMPGVEMNWDADDAGDVSRKGLKATNAITISGGIITVDAEDDAVHSDGSIAVTGGEMTLRSGDDGIHGETTLDISGGRIDVLYCYEGLEATAIYISDGYTNIIATDDGMNAGGMGMGMMGPGGMGRGSSGEATEETEETAETTETASEEAAETVETIVRITGGIVIVNSGGDGLDSNASMYIEGGTIFVSGPSSNWDSPIDYGEGSSEFVISGGTLMAAGYSGMFESPDTTDASQSSIYYIQSEYAPDNAITVLKKADGTILGEYAFANSYNGVLISTPDMAAGETYTLTIDGVETTIEMTAAQYSNRGGSGEMGGPGGMGRRP